MTSLGAFCFNCYLIKRPQKQFEIFLSHYKLAHAVLARWFKLRLRAICNGNIFLDSDCLESLDKIIEVVAYQPECLLVILGKETLTSQKQKIKYVAKSKNACGGKC